MQCSKCSSNRIASVSAKCSDLCIVEIAGVEHDGYVPKDMGIGGGDYVEIDLCLDCGHAQGTWPLEPTKLERVANKPKKPEFVPAPRQPVYENYLNELVSVCRRKGYQGVMAILPTLLGKDYDPQRIIAGVQELHRHPEFESLADIVMDKMQGWEHFPQMQAAVVLVTPPEDDDVDDDEED